MNRRARAGRRFEGERGNVGAKKKTAGGGGGDGGAEAADKGTIMHALGAAVGREAIARVGQSRSGKNQQERKRKYQKFQRWAHFGITPRSDISTIHTKFEADKRIQ